MEYHGEADVDEAIKMEELWKEICEKDGVEPRGLSACPIITCPGELILIEED